MAEDTWAGARAQAVPMATRPRLDGLLDVDVRIGQTSRTDGGGTLNIRVMTVSDFRFPYSIPDMSPLFWTLMVLSPLGAAWLLLSLIVAEWLAATAQPRPAMARFSNQPPSSR